MALSASPNHSFFFDKVYTFFFCLKFFFSQSFFLNFTTMSTLTLFLIVWLCYVYRHSRLVGFVIDICKIAFYIAVIGYIISLFS